MTFERFMELALHDPGHGYYTRRSLEIGRCGDFTTTAAISPALGKAVARWLLDQHRATGIRQLIELGPGNGTLACSVRAAMPWLQRRKFHFHFVESSAPLRALQQQAVGSGHATWHPTVQNALDSARGHALIYSNEFFDAFPVRRLQRTDDGWQELGVALTARGELTEIARPVAQEALPGTATRHMARIPPGGVFEVHESVRRWLGAMVPLWQAGAMLTIDYGSASPAPDPRRPCGTVRAYFLQHRLEGDAIHQNPGRQDLTADIRFPDLEAWGRELGLRTLLLTDQAGFLGPFADPLQPGDRAATDPQGAGSAFLVLAQARAVR